MHIFCLKLQYSALITHLFEEKNNQRDFFEECDEGRVMIGK